MARAWSLTDTLELGRSHAPPFNFNQVGNPTRVIENDDYSAVFFNEGGAATVFGGIVWQWDGTELLDIAGDFFINQTGTTTGDTSKIAGLSWFNGGLYAAYSLGTYPADEGKVAKWNGTTGSNSWTDVYTFEDEAAGDVIFQHYGWGSLWGKRRHCLDTDNSRIVTIGHRGTKNRMAASEDGITWSLQSTNEGYSDPLPYLVGREQGSNRRSLLTVEGYPPALLRAIGADGGNFWEFLNLSTGTSSVLVGYGDSRSFFLVNQSGTNWQLESSTDWGQTFTDTIATSIVNPPGQIFKRFNDTDIIWAERGNTQVWAWDSGSFHMIEDGTTGKPIWGFFRLNGNLCALCGVGGSGEAEIYCAGPVAGDVAEFYQGAGALDFKVNLSFPGVASGGMAVKDKLDTVVFGSDQGHKEMVDYSQYPYEAILDMDNGMATGAAISAMEWL